MFLALNGDWQVGQNFNMEKLIPVGGNKNIKDMSVEMQREFAYSAYINSGSTKETAEHTGLPEKRIRQWVTQLGWDMDKKEHYDIVHEKARDQLNSEVAELKANLLVSLYERTQELVTKVINDHDITELERAKALKDMVDSISKLEGGMVVGTQEESKVPGISAKNQQIFMNIVSNADSV
tara:strand:+ start:956 stop:1495 length:540 start_codon:yes stop_codon:yes gene_type:complete